MNWTNDGDGYFCVDTESARLLHVAEVPGGWAWAVMDASSNIFADGLSDSLDGAKRAAKAARTTYH
jgi:hypothetical protein